MLHMLWSSETPSRELRGRDGCFEGVEGNQASAGRLQSHPPPQPVLTWSSGFWWSWRGASLYLVWGWCAYGLRSKLNWRPRRRDILWNWRREQQWWYICTHLERGQRPPVRNTIRHQDQYTGSPQVQLTEGSTFCESKVTFQSLKSSLD